MAMTKRVTGMLLASAVALCSGCVTWTPVPYTPNPAAVSNPAEDFQRLVLTAKVWRPMRVEMHETFAALLYATQYGPTTVAIPFKEVAKLEVLTSGDGDYILRAQDAAGTNLYEYVATNQKNAQDLADALAALSGAKAPEPAQAPAPAENVFGTGGLR